MLWGNLIGSSHSPLLKYPSANAYSESFARLFQQVFIPYKFVVLWFSSGLVVIRYQLPQLHKFFDMYLFDICMIYI